MTPRRGIIAAILLGAVLRAGVLMWSTPWTPHHPDEHILPLEALGLWEGVTPREIGWPASTSRLVLSAALGAELIVDRGAVLWHERQSPETALHVIAQWIGAQYTSPARLYRTGRAISVAVGIGQLIVLAWAVGQWAGPAGTAAGTLAVAVASTTVLYSQYVLADIAGLLFATIVVGLAAKPTDRRILAMGALAGLAASSKFHFGIWLFTPILAAVRAPAWRKKVFLCAGTVALAGCVIVALVPWVWLDPLLAAKEIVGVIGAKLSGHPDAIPVAHNARLILGSIGLLMLAGVAAATALMDRQQWNRLLPVAVPPFMAAAAMMASRIVFDRYALVLVPGAAVVAAVGWERWLGSPADRVKRLGQAALIAIVAGSLVVLWSAERVAAETDVDVLVKEWVLEHVPSGRRIAVHDEMNAMLPRTAAQLRRCAAFVETPAAYRLKWAIEGVSDPAEDEPMRRMLLNDEQFGAYWCRRELEAPSAKAYEVVTYHDEPRFGAVMEQDAIREFGSGERTVTGGIDVLVMSRDVDANLAPVATFVTARGRRVIYER